MTPTTPGALRSVLNMTAAFALACAPLAISLSVAVDAQAAEPRTDWLDIEVGKSVVIETPRNASAIAITDPAVADIVTLGAANKIQIQGKSVGTTDLVIQLGPGVEPTRFEITVHQDLSDLIRRVGELVEGEPPHIYPLKDRIVVEGAVNDLDTLEHVAQVAQIYDEKFVNLLTVRGDHQVQLEVVFAEVSRTATRELGVNWFFQDPNDNAGVVFRSPSGSASSSLSIPDGPAAGGAGPIVAPATGAFGLSAFVPSIGVGAILGLLDGYHLSKFLSRPTLTCLSGQQCEFLAGGEFAIPSISGTGSNTTISTQYKEYGVKLLFVPTVLSGDMIDLRTTVEISEPDYSAGTDAGGLLVPGFIARKSKTHLRLDSGMTFAMAGMLDERTDYQRSQMPVLGDIPVIGTLFRYTKQVRTEREVMIFVTPRLIRPLGPGEVPAYPGTTEDNNPTDLELFLLGLDHQPGSRTAEPTGDVGLQR